MLSPNCPLAMNFTLYPRDFISRVRLWTVSLSCPATVHSTWLSSTGTEDMRKQRWALKSEHR